MYRFAAARCRHLVVGFSITAWAALVYQPWVQRPQPLIDMPGLLSISSAESTLAGRVRALVESQLGEGRMTPVTMTVLALQHTWFGLDGHGWVWSRFAVMIGVALSAYVLLLRLGVPPPGAACGSILFVIGDGARGAWHMPQVFEPLGVLFLFVALTFATGRGSLPLRTTGAALATVLAIWVKEPFLACVPSVLLLLLFGRERGDGRPVLRHMVSAASLFVGIIIAIGVMPILWGRVQAEPHAYAAEYSAAQVNIAGMANALKATILPVTREPLFPANLAFLAIMGLGTAIVWRRRHTRQLSVWAFALIGGIGLLYSAWPAFPGYYGLPALIGVAAIFGNACAAVVARGGAWRVAGVAVAGLIGAYGTLLALNEHQQELAQRRLDRRLASLVADATDHSDLAMVAPSGAPRGLARSLHLYASLLGAGGPSAALDIDCRGAAAILETQASHTVVIVLGDCDALPNERAVTVAEHYRQRDWLTLQSRQRTIAARVWRAPNSTA